MKRTNILLAATAISMSSLFSGLAFAQTSPDQGKMGMAATPGMTDGEIRKIDKETGKVTIKHNDIKHMDMPGMTMVFLAKDKSMLDKVQPGDKIRFMVVSENGKMIVTDIQPAK